MTLVKTTARKATPAVRKRAANHHRKGHEYGKAYWPYLPMVAIVSLGFLLNSWMGSVQHRVLSYATNMSAQDLLDDTNIQRKSNGLDGLHLNTALSQAAQAKAADMAASNYWAHTSPSGKTPWTFIAAAGYSYATAGENLAYGFSTSSETISGWMNSPGHRANILNATYVDVGFGILNVENYQDNGSQTIVVAMYASPYKETVAAQDTSPSGTETTASSQPTQNQTSSANQITAAAGATEKQDTTTPTSTSTRGNTEKTDTSPSKKVSRIQVITAANVAWTQFALSMVVSVAILIFLLRHSFAWHRFLVHGKSFVLNHPLLDIAFVTIATFGTVLLQTAGFIR